MEDRVHAEPRIVQTTLSGSFRDRPYPVCHVRGALVWARDLSSVGNVTDSITLFPPIAQPLYHYRQRDPPSSQPDQALLNVPDMRKDRKGFATRSHKLQQVASSADSAVRTDGSSFLLPPFIIARILSSHPFPHIHHNVLPWSIDPLPQPCIFPALSRSEAIGKSQTSVHNPVVAPIRLIPPTFSFPKRQSTQNKHFVFQNSNGTHPKKMCYYDNFKFACQDWKWGNFRQHCQKEYRTGETCGMKMIYNTMLLAEKCPSCEKIEKKLRRRDKAMSDWKRWSQQGGKFKASMEKAVEDVKTLEREIEALQREKERRYAAVGNARRN
ncbi:unnamed protein product [Zymoseptoria tritici ST99CH_3D7]|uniref:Uncharacterized protein n=3 Tax=Zymoseptoria TaxID=1047167 RepID=A0A1X7REZ9_ZYMT9|nr:unnamed protein product [Zymoseptoria tritici ST99CH_3D7]